MGATLDQLIRAVRWCARLVGRHQVLTVLVVAGGLVTFVLFKQYEQNADTREEIGARTELNARGTFGNCVEINRVVDGIYSLVDDRAVSVRTARSVLKDPTATPSQKARAVGTITASKRELVQIQRSIPKQHCVAP